jgi:hypothetical protein
MKLEGVIQRATQRANLTIFTNDPSTVIILPPRRRERGEVWSAVVPTAIRKVAKHPFFSLGEECGGKRRLRGFFILRTGRQRSLFKRPAPL